MVYNDSVDKVKDYSGNNQIGSISFAKANDLITTNDIVEKATTDVNFQLAIADKYHVIRKMLDMNSYAELLKLPFYINLIISKRIDIDNISDENELREYISQKWNA